MRFSDQYGVPVTARGAGAGYVGGAVPIHGGIVVSLERMVKILEINPADGVAIVEPGVITGDLQDAVRKQGWYYPPDPASLRECSIGGNVATNAGGPRCLKYGVTRQYVLGLKVVLPNGDVLHAGGRCHKNRQGFDLTSIFVGSEGMLGIVTEITLRIIPYPPARAVLGATFKTFAEAAASVQNEDIVVPRSQLVALVSFAATLQKTSGFPVACFGHAGDGNIHVNIMVADINDPVQRERADEVLDKLFHKVLSLGGVISGEHGIGLAKKRWFPLAVDEVGRAAHAAMKLAFDPKGLLNPSKFL